MKRPLLLLFGAICAGCATPDSQTNDPVTDALLEKVVVEEIDLDLGEPQDHDGEHLWKTFANKPYESQFTKLSTENWFVACERFQTRILSLAQTGGFDVASLRSALAGLNLKKSDRTARVPVGAFAARKGTDTVWIIVIKWEYAGSYEEGGQTHWFGLGHIEVVAVRMEDGRKIDSVRCG